MRFKFETGPRTSRVEWFCGDSPGDVEPGRKGIAHACVLVGNGVAADHLPDCRNTCGDAGRVVGPLHPEADSGRFYLVPELHGPHRFALHIFTCPRMAEALATWTMQHPKKANGARLGVAFRLSREPVQRAVAPPARMSDERWSEWLREHTGEDGIIESTRGGALQRWAPFADPTDLPETLPAPAQLRLKIIAPDGTVWGGGRAFVSTTSRPRATAAEWFNANGEAKAARDMLVADAVRAGGRLVFVLPACQAPKPSPVEQLRSELAELRRQVAQLRQ